MNKEDHINHWESQVDGDYDCAQVLFDAGHYSQALFWAHLSLEKMCKALWIKNNTGNVPPRIHHLTRIILQTGEQFTPEELKILSDMNLFQIGSRYPDFTSNASMTVTQAVCKEYLEKSKTMIACIRQKLQLP